MIQQTEQLRSIDALRASLAEAAAVAVTDRFPANWLVIRNGKIPDLDAPLSGLNVTHSATSLAIHVTEQLASDRIVGLLFIDDAADATGVSEARVEIKLQSGSAANFIEYHSSVGDATHHAHTVIQLSLADRACCNYVRFQDRQAVHEQTGHLTATLGKDSQLHHAAFDLGGSKVRNHLDIKLAGAGSMTTFCGLFLAGGEQQIENHTRVDHLVGPASSEQEYRGIAAGASHCAWHGIAVVHRGADGTNASQESHNLLLSPAAEIDATPQLEIYADDVKARHGTTFGELDQSALFYLRTRGLDESAARRLLIVAYAEKIVSRLPLPALRASVSEIVGQRIATLITAGAQ